jgi:hypothetical protein
MLANFGYFIIDFLVGGNTFLTERNFILTYYTLYVVCKQQVGAATVPSAFIARSGEWSQSRHFHVMSIHVIHANSCQFMSIHGISWHFMTFYVIYCYSCRFMSFHFISFHVY